MSVLVAFSVTPLGVGESVGEIVAEAVRVVRDSGLPNQTDSMFTVVEGDTWEEVMGVVQRAVEAELEPRRLQRGSPGLTAGPPERRLCRITGDELQREERERRHGDEHRGGPAHPQQRAPHPASRHLRAQPATTAASQGVLTVGSA